MESKNREQLRLAGKWACYGLALAVMLCLQTMPGFLTIGAAKPVFVLPLCLAAAMYEGEYAGAIYGCICGLLWDFTGGRTVGLLALTLMLLCFVSAVSVRLYLQASAGNFLLLCVLCGGVLLTLDFAFHYWLWGYAEPGVHYLTTVLPTLVFTCALSPVSFYLVRRLHRAFPE